MTRDEIIDNGQMEVPTLTVHKWGQMDTEITRDEIIDNVSGEFDHTREMIIERGLCNP